MTPIFHRIDLDTELNPAFNQAMWDHYWSSSSHMWLCGFAETYLGSIF